MRAWTLAFDIGAVLLFVAIGRANHASDTALSDFASTAAPFLAGLAAGWLLTRAWRDATGTKTGLGVVATTVGLGMLLRRLVWGSGTAFSFVLVATTSLALFVVGWRLVVRRLVTAPGSPSASPDSTVPRS